MFVVGSSGHRAEKALDPSTLARYNAAALQAREIARHLGCASLAEALHCFGSADRAAQVLKEALTDRRRERQLGGGGGHQSGAVWGLGGCHGDEGRAGEVPEQAESAAGRLPLVESVNSELVPLLRRLKQFEFETERVVPGLAAALSPPPDTPSSRLAELRSLSSASHEAAALALGNLVDATRWLEMRAAALGSLGSSAFGAGFGGSVWAVVPAFEALSFERRWGADYREAFPEFASGSYFFAMRPGPGAGRI